MVDVTKISLWQLTLLAPFLSLVAWEAFLCGSGRTLSYGLLTPRMALFGVALLVTASRGIEGYRAARWAYEAAGVFMILLMFSALVGLVNQADPEFILNDIKPLSYFLMLPYFATSIRHLGHVELCARQLRYSAIILCVGYLLLVLALEFGVIGFRDIYFKADETDQLMFRGTTGHFFYKGFLFLAVAIMFYLPHPTYLSRIICAFFLLAIWFTYTRMFVLVSAFGIMLFYVIRGFEASARAMVISIAASILLVGSLGFFLDSMGDRSDSDAERVQQLVEVNEMMNPVVLCIGHGLGIGIPCRIDRFEITYLEVLHKQGLVGLVFWGWFGTIGLLDYWHCTRSRFSLAALPWLLSIIVIYVQSIANPFLNNSIGMVCVFISIVSLKVIRRELEASKLRESARAT